MVLKVRRADDTTTVAPKWIEHLDNEYRELPGLRLSLAEAARLWGLQAPQCRALLGALVERGRLVEMPDGLYCVVGGLCVGPVVRRRGRPCAS